MKRFSLIFLIPVFLLSSCAKIYINEIARTTGFSVSTERAKKFLVVSSNELLLYEFNKTFSKKYSNNRAYLSEYLRLFSSQLKLSGAILNVNYDNSEDWDIIRSNNIALDDQKLLNELFSKCDADYIIFIQRVEINNKIQNSTTAGGPNNAPRTTSQEFCVVNVRIQILDKTTRKRMLEFEAKGESSVNFFAFEKALSKATENSIRYSTEFLKSGKKEF